MLAIAPSAGSAEQLQRVPLAVATGCYAVQSIRPSEPVMTDWFIPDSWLAAISGKGLLYPCAGNDLAEPIEIFGNYVDDFVFSDIHYSQGMKLGLVSRTEFKRECSRIEGDQDAVMEERRHGNLCFRYLEPSVLVERYVREIDGRAITVK